MPLASPVPRWFVEELAALYLCFPSAGQMPSAAPIAWWRHLAELPPEAMRRAFRRAPRELVDTHWLPSAELVRRIADSEAKTLARPVDLGRLALDEPEPELPPDNPWHETLERYKRGEIPGSEVVSTIVGSVAAGKGVG